MLTHRRCLLQGRFSPAVKPSRRLQCPPLKCGPGTSTAGDLDIVLANAHVASKALKGASSLLHGGGTALGMSMRWSLRWDLTGQGFEEEVSLQPGAAGAGGGGLGDELPVVLSCGFDWDRPAREPSSSLPPPPDPGSQSRSWSSGDDDDDAPAAHAASGLWQTDLSALRHEVSEHDDTYVPVVHPHAPHICSPAVLHPLYTCPATSCSRTQTFATAVLSISSCV